MTRPPRVSVIIPTHNRASLVTSAVDSVLSQAGVSPQVIVVDDGSTDGTAQALAAFRAGGGTYLAQAHAGAPTARNRGAKAAAGPYALFLDSDDVLLPGSLAALLQTAGAQPAAGLVGGGYVQVDEAGASLQTVTPWLRSPELSLARLVGDCAFIPSATLVRLDWFKQVGGFDAALPAAQDWDLWLRLAQAGCPMAWHRGLVCHYRQHAGMLTSDPERRRQGALRALAKVYAQPNVPSNVAVRQGEAIGLVHLQAAARHFALGQHEAGRLAVEQAALCHPPWQAPEAVLAALLRQGRHAVPTEHWADYQANVLASLGHSRAARRRAGARLAADDLFAAYQQRDWPTVRRHWWSAVGQDAAWLKQRGFVSIGLQALRQRLRPATPPHASRPTPEP